MHWYPDLLIPTTIVLCMYLSFWMKYESHFKFLNIYVSKLFQYLAGLPSFLDLYKKVCKFWATKFLFFEGLVIWKCQDLHDYDGAANFKCFFVSVKSHNFQFHCRTTMGWYHFWSCINFISVFSREWNFVFWK